MTPTRKANLKRLLKVAAAPVLLVALYTAADWRAVGRALASLDAGYLGAGLLLLVPQTLVSAARWKRLATPLASISLGRASRNILAASALNLILPSKMGDLFKAGMLPIDRKAEATLALAAAVALLEKIADVAALALLWGAGGLGINGFAVAGLLAALVAAGGCSRGRTSAGFSLASYSLALWSLHLLQIDCFLKAAGVFVPWATAAARVPAAVFAGLLPISFWGLGIRDSALVWLFSDVAPAAAMAAVGVLTVLRYLVPGAVGIPFALSEFHRGGKKESGKLPLLQDGPSGKLPLLRRKESGRLPLLRAGGGGEQRFETNLRPGLEARQIGEQLFDRPEAAVDQFALARANVRRLDVEQVNDAQVNLADLGQVVVQ